MGQYMAGHRGVGHGEETELPSSHLRTKRLLRQARDEEAPGNADHDQNDELEAEGIERRWRRGSLELLWGSTSRGMLAVEFPALKKQSPFSLPDSSIDFSLSSRYNGAFIWLLLGWCLWFVPVLIVFPRLRQNPRSA